MDKLSCTLPVVSSETMRVSDKYTVDHCMPVSELVEVVGEAIANAYPFTKEQRVAIVAGTGNNGLDGICLAKALTKRGIPCHLFLKAFSQIELWRIKLKSSVSLGFPITYLTTKNDFGAFPLIVDCLFGTGIRGNAKYLAAAVIGKMNEAKEQCGAKILSIDLPSGLDADSGMGSPVVKADHTISVQFHKQGLFFGQGPDVSGTLSTIDVGIELQGSAAQLVTKETFKPLLRERNMDCHKGSFGYVSIIGGSRSYAGAMKLANLSQSALRAGCGVARLCVPECITEAVSPYLLESTLYALPSDQEFMRFDESKLSFLLSHSKAIALGMGWGIGPDNNAILDYLITHANCPLLIDADGLNTLAGMDSSIFEKANCPLILTPHPKEFERLSGIPTSEILQDPIKHAKAYAEAHHCILLLKGSTTVVTDGSTVLLSNSGCPGMATAGSGDVLSGLLIGLLGYLPAEATTVACGAFLAGLAGEMAEKQVGSIGMVASDTTRFIAEAIHSVSAD